MIHNNDKYCNRTSDSFIKDGNNKRGMVFGKTPNMGKTIDNLIMGFLAIVVIFALLPTALNTLIDGTAELFNGTVFYPIFEGGLIWYALAVGGVIALGFAFLGTKTRR